MKDEWENGIKRHFKPVSSSKEFIVKIPAEAFKGAGASGMNDSSKKPIIKDGRIHFTRSVASVSSHSLAYYVADKYHLIARTLNRPSSTALLALRLYWMHRSIRRRNQSSQSRLVFMPYAKFRF
jgi:hypothetical protein